MLAWIYWLQESFKNHFLFFYGQTPSVSSVCATDWEGGPLCGSGGRILEYDLQIPIGEKKRCFFFFFQSLNCDTYSYNVDLVFLSPVQHWVLLSWHGYYFSSVWWCLWDCRLCLKNKRSLSPSQNPTCCIWRHKYVPEGTSSRQALAGTFFSGAAKAPFSYSWARWCLNLPICCL